MDPTIHTHFLLQPIFLRGLSGSLHLAFLILLFASWFCTKFIRVTPNDSKNLTTLKFSKLLYYNQTLFCCLGLSLLSLVLCFFNYCYWHPSGRSHEIIITLLDSLLKTLAWLGVSVYLYLQFRFTSEFKYPTLLRVWWVFFFLISCYSLLVDYVYYKKHQTVPIQFLLSDIISTVAGLLLCCVGFFGKNEGVDSLLQDPLLNDNDSSESNLGENFSLFSDASFFSILTFSWISSLISIGNKKTLDLKDIPQLASVDSVKGSFPILRNKIQSDSDISGQVTTFTLLKALICTTWKEIILTAFLSFIYSVASYVGPYLIDSFVQYLNGNQEFKNQGYVLVSIFFLAKLVECFAQRHWYFRLQQAGIRAKAALIAMIYSKGLTLSCQSKQVHTSGDIINFMTVDAERISDFYWVIHDPWLVLVQVSLALLILYKDIGLAFIAAFGATLMVMLANLPLGSLQEKFQDKLMKSKDRRMKVTSEVLKNMRILKLQGWEMNFLSKIIELRKIEAVWLKKYVYTWAITLFFFWGAPTFVSVITFGACMLMGIPLGSGKILSALATFRILQEPIYNLPDTISILAQIKVSLDRIAAFLRLEDLQPNVIEKTARGGSNTAIEIIDGNFSWDLSLNSPTLKDINISFSHGTRVAVCGTVGSGKSTLLSCILGEVPKISGSVKVSGTKAYVAQSPWIQSGKIVDNILFGKEMDRERYEKVVEACALKKDLAILPFGDQTVIGERGINLSGGQKQRIQFARALYRDADIYIFDDPFSAVDAHTGSHLFKECILKLLDQKTVIYVTHQVEFLPSADVILVMKDGKITESGNYNDILNSGIKFMELVGAHEKALSTLDNTVSSVDEEGTSTSTGRVTQIEQDTDDIVGTKKQGQLVQEEEREKGGVSFSIYWKYITTGYKGAFVPFILLAQILFQLLQIGSTYWIAWASPVSETEEPNVGVSPTLLIGVYVALAIASSLCILARTTLLAAAGFETANILFNKVHMCIFRAPMSFFDSTPSGRILNRASTDQSDVDLNIPNKVGGFSSYVIQLIGIFAVMSAVSWQILLVFVPVIIICIWYQKYFIPSIREMARLRGVCKAPVIQHFAETITGSTTIRSFDDEYRFQDTNMKMIDGYSRPNFHNAGAMECLSFRLDMLSSITFALTLIFLISLPQGAIDPSIAGLAVTYGLSLNTIQVRCIWSLCDMESRIISVERILQYTCIPSEPPLVIESNRPEPQWPSHGEVDIHNLKVRYAQHLPFVLRGLTCTFFGEKKTGIVGRTGSGKSTLIQTLFRIVEPTEGEILIDGVNISSIGLHDLRSRLSIIPQDPTMFDGTLRSNLDPLEEYTDEQIWEALEKCQLGDEVRKKENKLDSIGSHHPPLINFFLQVLKETMPNDQNVNENGENWSVGQRQLVCLGRVLLKKSKVLVLDEATASVDTVTDNMIQQTLRQHFSNSTVITIAHRITSLLDSDMVLLLDNGLIEEYDSPTKLLGNKSSSFARLVAEYSLRSNSNFG